MIVVAIIMNASRTTGTSYSGNVLRKQRRDTMLQKIKIITNVEEILY